MDTISSTDRSRVMSSVRSSRTGPELYARSHLWAAGFRFAKSAWNLPGKPDIVLPAYRSVIFVHGCFWHSHKCEAGQRPLSNQLYWLPKLDRNTKRDRRVVRQLRGLGWHCFTVWECRLKADTSGVIRRLQQLRRTDQAKADGV